MKNDDLNKRLKTAWVSYHLITTGAGVPKGLWSWLRDSFPDLWAETLDCWRDFCRCWRGYLDGRLDQQSFDSALMALGRLLLRCRTAYDLAHNVEPPVIPRRCCLDCRHFQPILQDLNDHTWGTCARDDNGTLIWSLSGCPGWTPKKSTTPSKNREQL